MAKELMEEITSAGENEVVVNKKYITVDDNYNKLDIATDSVMGLVKTGYTQTDKKYPLKTDENGNAYTEVPSEIELATDTEIGGFKTNPMKYIRTSDNAESSVVSSDYTTVSTFSIDSVSGNVTTCSVTGVPSVSGATFKIPAKYIDKITTIYLSLKINGGSAKSAGNYDNSARFNIATAKAAIKENFAGYSVSYYLFTNWSALRVSYIEISNGFTIDEEGHLYDCTTKSVLDNMSETTLTFTFTDNTTQDIVFYTKNT